MAAIIQRTEIDRQETDCVLPVFFCYTARVSVYWQFTRVYGTMIQISKN